jgi:hypothetical protein
VEVEVAAVASAAYPGSADRAHAIATAKAVSLRNVIRQPNGSPISSL